jgi:drug/metabolite transporter (DMT)-like permease
VDDAWIPIAFALLGALLLGLSGIAARFGFVTSDLLEGTLATYLASATVLIPSTLLMAWPISISGRSFGLFLLDGLLGLSSVFLIYTGIRTVGPSVSYALKSTAPVTAVIFALVVQGERSPLPVYVGGLLAVVGVAALSLATDRKRLEFDRRVLAPMASAVFFGLSYNVRRAALPEVSHPIVGLLIAISVAGSICVLLMVRRRRRLAWTPGVRFFLVAGVFQAGGLLSGYTALRYGQVAVVAPVLTSSPLFVLALSPILLRKMEQLTVLRVVGALTVLAGVVLISISPAR